MMGQTVFLPAQKQSRLTANGVEPQEIVLGIRPEHVELSETGFAGTVEVTEMMGSNIHIHARFGTEEVVIVVPECDREFRKGETVHFVFTAEKMHLFSKETEKNLEQYSTSSPEE